MTKAQFLSRLARRLRSYDFCATLLDDDWCERMSDRAHAYLTEDEEKVLNELEGDGADDEIRGDAIQTVLDAFLWYLVKNRLGQKKLKKMVEKVRNMTDSSRIFAAGYDDDLKEILDYLESLQKGRFLLGV